MKLRPILVAAHPRSGTHATIDFIRTTFRSTRSWRLWGLPVGRLYVNVESLTLRNQPVNERVIERAFARPYRALMKTHFLPDFSESWIENESGSLPEHWRKVIDDAHLIYVTRDPLAVMRSYRNFMSQFEPAYAEMTLMEFCESRHWTGELDRLAWWEKHVSAWLAVDNVIHVRYEELLSAPESVAERLSSLLGEWPAASGNFLPRPYRSVWEARVSRLTSLAPKSSAVLPKLGDQSEAGPLRPEDRKLLNERLQARSRHLLSC